MKQPIKIYLDPETKKKLLDKARDVGFQGRGALSLYLEKISREPIIFLDDNSKTLLQALHLNSK